MGWINENRFNQTSRTILMESLYRWENGSVWLFRSIRDVWSSGEYERVDFMTYDTNTV